MHGAGACHAIQDGARQWRRDHLIPDPQHDVHRADFIQIFAIDAIQIQHLRIAGIGGIALAGQARGVIAGGFGFPGAAFHGAHMRV